MSRRCSRIRAGLALVLSAAAILASPSGCGFRRPADPAIEQQIEARLQHLLIQSIVKLRNGDTESAEAILDLAAELRSGDPRILDAYGCVYFQSGRIESAEVMFRRSISIDPNYSRPYAHLAAVAERRGDLAAANDLLLLALTLNPLNSRARINYAVLLRQYRPDLAYRELSKAYALTGPGE